MYKSQFTVCVRNVGFFVKCIDVLALYSVRAYRHCQERCYERSFITCYQTYASSSIRVTSVLYPSCLPYLSPELKEEFPRKVVICGLCSELNHELKKLGKCVTFVHVVQCNTGHRCARRLSDCSNTDRSPAVCVRFSPALLRFAWWRRRSGRSHTADTVYKLMWRVLLTPLREASMKASQGVHA